MAPTPKPPGARRRRNTSQAKWRSLPSAGRAGAAPRLPTKRPAWLKRTREWWATIWASPMATAWAPADVDGLVRLAELKDLFARGDAPASALPAMQQLEDRYGLNPKARQALLWQIATGDEDQGDDQPDRPQLASVHRLAAVDRRAAKA
jgi:hypothetical protein